VAQSDEKAAHWFGLAAAQGNALSQSNLGLMYDRGRGVKQSDQEAVKWYRLSAAQGEATASSIWA
jgi:TPR repeat protein